MGRYNLVHKCEKCVKADLINNRCTVFTECLGTQEGNYSFWPGQQGKHLAAVSCFSLV